LEEEEEEDGVGLLWAKLEEEEELAESLNMFFSKIDESGLGMSPMSTSILREEERKEGESGKRGGEQGWTHIKFSMEEERLASTTEGAEGEVDFAEGEDESDATVPLMFEFEKASCFDF
jgi:hypothetical protein